MLVFTSFVLFMKTIVEDVSNLSPAPGDGVFQYFCYLSNPELVPSESKSFCGTYSVYRSCSLSFRLSRSVSLSLEDTW